MHLDSSPNKRAAADHDDDSDTDFQEEKAVSEAEESGNETDVVDVEELRSPAKRRGSRSVYASQANLRMCFVQAYCMRSHILTLIFKGTPFRRVNMDDQTYTSASRSDSAQTINGVDNDVTLQLCPACDRPHAVGYCLLKHSGVEHCPLCGIPHFGHGRTCPHLNSVTQCRLMLEALKKSPESKPEKSLAKWYIVSIINDLNRRKQRDDARQANGTTGLSGRTTAMPNGAPYSGHNPGWPGPPAGQNGPPSYAHFGNQPNTSSLPPPRLINAGTPPTNTFRYQASNPGS